MVKIFVIYDSKYGNTKIVAEKIIEGLGQVEGTDTAIAKVKEVNLGKVTDSDTVLIGSPNHVGKPARVPNLQKSDKTVRGGS